MLCYLGLCCDPRNSKGIANCQRARPSPDSGTTLTIVYKILSTRLSEGLAECLTLMPQFTFRRAESPT